MGNEKDIIVPQWKLLEQQQIMAQVRHMFAASGKKPLAFAQVYGCQQNEADMEIIRGMLLEMGYGFTEDAQAADFIIINTCAVREGAEFRIYGNIGSFKRLKTQNKALVIAVCGCMMQQPHVVDKIKRSYPYVDIVFGTHKIYKMPSMLMYRLKSGKKSYEIGEDTDGFAEGLPALRGSGASAWVTVMQGCNNFCSYCIVPYTRGRERSRRMQDVIEEVSLLAKKGYKEVTLLGQNVNSYGKDLGEGAPDFASLIRTINEIEGISRIRFMTSHPKDLSDRLIETMADCEHVCKFLHLPFQSGSSRILSLMNRQYTKEQYLALIDKLKRRIPGIALSTDVIVGFPGETDEDFAHTMDVIKSVRFDNIYSFIYSRRKGTPAADMEDDLRAEEHQQHFDELLAVQEEICQKSSDGYIGKVVEVLVEGESKSDESMLSGRTSTNKLVHFRAEKSLVGQLVNVQITGAEKWYITGEIKA